MKKIIILVVVGIAIYIAVDFGSKAGEMVQGISESRESAISSIR